MGVGGGMEERVRKSIEKNKAVIEKAVEQIEQGQLSQEEREENETLIIEKLIVLSNILLNDKEKISKALYERTLSFLETEIPKSPYPQLIIPSIKSFLQNHATVAEYLLRVAIEDPDQFANPVLVDALVNAELEFSPGNSKEEQTAAEEYYVFQRYVKSILANRAEDENESLEMPAEGFVDNEDLLGRESDNLENWINDSSETSPRKRASTAASNDSVLREVQMELDAEKFNNAMIQAQDMLVEAVLKTYDDLVSRLEDMELSEAEREEIGKKIAGQVETLKEYKENYEFSEDVSARVDHIIKSNEEYDTGIYNALVFSSDPESDIQEYIEAIEKNSKILDALIIEALDDNNYLLLKALTEADFDLDPSDPMIEALEDCRQYLQAHAQKIIEDLSQLKFSTREEMESVNEFQDLQKILGSVRASQILDNLDLPNAQENSRESQSNQSLNVDNVDLEEFNRMMNDPQTYLRDSAVESESKATPNKANQTQTRNSSRPVEKSNSQSPEALAARREAMLKQREALADQRWSEVTGISDITKVGDKLEELIDAIKDRLLVAEKIESSRQSELEDRIKLLEQAAKKSDFRQKIMELSEKSRADLIKNIGAQKNPEVKRIMMAALGPELLQEKKEVKQEQVVRAVSATPKKIYPAYIKAYEMEVGDIMKELDKLNREYTRARRPNEVLTEKQKSELRETMQAYTAALREKTNTDPFRVSASRDVNAVRRTYEKFKNIDSHDVMMLYILRDAQMARILLKERTDIERQQIGTECFRDFRQEVISKGSDQLIFCIQNGVLVNSTPVPVDEKILRVIVEANLSEDITKAALNPLNPPDEKSHIAVDREERRPWSELQAIVDFLEESKRNKIPDPFEKSTYNNDFKIRAAYKFIEKYNMGEILEVMKAWSDTADIFLKHPYFLQRFSENPELFSEMARQYNLEDKMKKYFSDEHNLEVLLDLAREFSDPYVKKSNCEKVKDIPIKDIIKFMKAHPEYADAFLKERNPIESKLLGRRDFRQEIAKDITFVNDVKNGEVSRALGEKVFAANLPDVKAGGPKEAGYSYLELHTIKDEKLRKELFDRMNKNIQLGLPVPSLDTMKKYIGFLNSTQTKFSAYSSMLQKDSDPGALLLFNMGKNKFEKAQQAFRAYHQKKSGIAEVTKVDKAIKAIKSVKKKVLPKSRPRMK